LGGRVWLEKAVPPLFGKENRWYEALFSMSALFHGVEI